MALLRKLFWVAIFLISTLSFVVLFEHGPDKFTENLGKQVEDFYKFAEELLTPPKTEKGA